MFTTILHIIFIVVFVYLSITIFYFLLVVIVGKLRRNPFYPDAEEKKRIAVLIPSYKEDHIIVSTARKAKQHNYPSTHFDVFVAAHGLEKETIEQLKLIPVNVLEVHFELGSKARSL